MKNPFASVLFTLLFLFSVTPVFSGTLPEEGAVLTWKPTRSQLRRWSEPGPRAYRPGGPLVSLKIALPPGTSIQAVVVSERWLPFPVPAEGLEERPTMELDGRGIWKEISYQEVAIHPLRTGAHGQVEVLTALRFRVTPTVKEASLPSSPPRQAFRPFPPGTFFADFSAGRRWSQAEEHRPMRALSSGTPLELDSPVWLLPVSHNGIVRLTGAYLESQGLDLSGVDPRDIHLWCRGVEIPIVIDGEEDGRFDQADALFFYGQMLSIHDRDLWNGGDYTSTNVYRLTVGGTPGLRMQVVDCSPSQSYPQAQKFECTLHVERQDYQVIVNHYDPNRDLWYMMPFYGGAPGASAGYSFAVSHLAGTSAQIQARILGFGTTTHSVSVSLNGAAPTGGSNPATWTTPNITTQTWQFSAGLSEGQNTLTLRSGLGDYQMPDFFDVTYDRTLDADSNSLLITDANANARYVSSGYSAAPYILDLSRSDPATGLYLPRLLTGATFSSGTATFEMAQDPSVTLRTVALSSAPLLTDSVERAGGRNLSDPSLGADLLIITHPDFHPDGQDQIWLDYLARREAQMQVQVVDIQDVYDNFSYGIMDPTAIRTFLQAVAANWNPVPKYVLLVGDGSYDYQNYKQDPTFKNWVPTMMFEDVGDSTYMGRYPSDAWYADVDGDGFPDMAVGRLPARTYAQFAAMLTKIMAYEDQTLAGTWYKTGLYLADTWTQPWEQVFETFNNELQATYTTPPWQNLHVYFHDPPYNGVNAEACAADIRTAWDRSAIVHYDGHSGISFWGKSSAIFTSYPSRNCGSGTCMDSDVGLLPPITLPPSPPHAPLPFVVNSSCYNSAFDEQGDPCLMEALIDRPDGGSIGSCGFSTIAWPDEEEAFNSAIFDQAFLTPKVRTLGDLVEAGRFALPSTDERSVMGNVLLGDPSMRLRLPAPAPPLNPAIMPADSAVSLSWTPPADAVSGYRIYRSQDGGATYSLAASLPASDTSHLDMPLTNGQTYSYYLTSADAEGFEGPPTAVLTAEPAEGLCSVSCLATVPGFVAIGTPASFQAFATVWSCLGEPTYDWDFGDGSPHSAEQAPLHVYAGEGAFHWTLTVSVDQIKCQESGSINVVNPPVVTQVSKAGNPFRIIILGDRFHSDVSVFIDGQPWSNVKWKNAGKVVLKGGSSLKRVFVKGIMVNIRLVNGDGGEVTVGFNRTTRQWIPGE